MVNGVTGTGALPPVQPVRQKKPLTEVQEGIDQQKKQQAQQQQKAQEARQADKPRHQQRIVDITV